MSVQTNLPSQRFPLIGREKELVATRQLLLRDDVCVASVVGKAQVPRTRDHVPEGSVDSGEPRVGAERGDSSVVDDAHRRKHSALKVQLRLRGVVAVKLVRDPERACLGVHVYVVK